MRPPSKKRREAARGNKRQPSTRSRGEPQIAFRDALPISVAQLTELLEYLRCSGVTLTSSPAFPEESEDIAIKVNVEIEGCDGTRRHTRGWAQTFLGDSDALTPWMNSCACPCDCSLIEFVCDELGPSRAATPTLH